MKKALLLALMLASTSWGALMLNTSNASPGPGFSIFTIDGITGRVLLCDEFTPNITSNQYNASVISIADILNAISIGNNNAIKDLTLIRRGFTATAALAIYRKVAMLDLIAYASPLDSNLVASVVWANRFLVDGTGRVDNATQALLNQVNAQNFNNFDLTGFRVYAGPLNIGQTTNLTQEMTGVVGGGGGTIPEPTTALLFGTGLISIALYRRKKAA
jgi:hypothetical protein